MSSLYFALSFRWAFADVPFPRLESVYHLFSGSLGGTHLKESSFLIRFPGDSDISSMKWFRSNWQEVHDFIKPHLRFEILPIFQNPIQLPQMQDDTCIKCIYFSWYIFILINLEVFCLLMCKQSHKQNHFKMELPYQRSCHAGLRPQILKILK